MMAFRESQPRNLRTVSSVMARNTIDYSFGMISLVSPGLLLVGPARSFLFLLGEALGLFAADLAFPNVISTTVVSHKFLYSPACCVVARANFKQLIYRATVIERRSVIRRTDRFFFFNENTGTTTLSRSLE